MILLLGEQRVNLDSRYVEGKSTSTLLTPLEVSLLRHLAQANKPVSVEELHREVWEYHPKIQTRAVRYTVNRLRRKIEPDPNKPRYLVTIRGLGYRLNIDHGQTAPPLALPSLATSNLPQERNSFHGRAVELRQLETLFARHALVSVVGSGGVGKTRLVIHFAHKQRDAYPGGVWFCDLSEAYGEDDVTTAVNQTFGFGAHGNPQSRLGPLIAQLGQCLLILDNLEQILLEAREVVEGWLAEAPEARFLVTSRAVLGLPEEALVDLKPLPPEDGLNLFIDRAAALRAGRAEDDLESVRDLVVALDGLPLAIELAVGRIRLMPPKQILSRMNQRFQLLRGPGRRERHSNLWATIDWSWELLETVEQQGLAQLSVFEGGFDVEQAEAVVEVDRSWAVDILQGLVDQSMIQWKGDGRFDLLVSIQSYASQKLSEHRLAAEVRHGQFFAKRGQREALWRLRRQGTAADWERMTINLANFKIACHRAILRGDAAVAAACGLAAAAVLQRVGPVQSAIDLIQKTQAMNLPARHAEQMFVEAVLYKTAGHNHDHILQRAEAALQHAIQTADRALEVEARRLLGEQLCEAGKFEKAGEYLETALKLSRQAGDHLAEGLTLQALSMIDRRSGQMEHALAKLHQAQAKFQTMNARYLEGRAMAITAAALQELNRIDESRTYAMVALERFREAGDRMREAIALNGIGTLLHIQQQPQRALQFYQEALLVYRSIGNLQRESIVLYHISAIYMELGQYSQALDGLSRAVDNARVRKDIRWEGIILELYARCRVRTDPKGAYADILRAESLLRETQSLRVLLSALCTRIEILIVQDDKPSARALLEEAQKLAAQIHMPEDSARSHRLRSCAEELQ